MRYRSRSLSRPASTCESRLVPSDGIDTSRRFSISLSNGHGSLLCVVLTRSGKGYLLIPRIRSAGASRFYEGEDDTAVSDSNSGLNRRFAVTSVAIESYLVGVDWPRRSSPRRAWSGPNVSLRTRRNNVSGDTCDGKRRSSRPDAGRRSTAEAPGAGGRTAPRRYIRVGAVPSSVPPDSRQSGWWGAS